MTLNLFGVKDALTAEDKERIKLKQARERALKRWGTKEEAIEGANGALAETQPEEAPKSNSPD